MKKSLLFVAVLCMFFSLQAQDTLHFSTLPGHYYSCTNWWNEYDSVYSHDAFGYLGDVALFFHTPDTLTVYGLVGIFTGGLYADTFPDGMLEAAVDCMRLYNYDTNARIPVQVGEDLCMNLLPSSVSYYFALDRYIECPWARDPLPVYERYFETPIVVQDTFFVGFTRSTFKGSPYGRPTELIIDAQGFVGSVDSTYVFNFVDQFHFDLETLQWNIRLHPSGTRFEYFLYPILTPDTTHHAEDTVVHIDAPDTIWYGYHNSSYYGFDNTWHGKDTAGYVFDTVRSGYYNSSYYGFDSTGRYKDPAGHGIGAAKSGDEPEGAAMAGLLSHYTTVAPNPAATQVKVTSSFGLVAIEVYDAKGALVMRREGDGMVAELDVASWPRGSYLLHITTRAGTTVKKLLLQ